MRLWPTLLRMLLIAALALNGAVPAMATVQMGHGLGEDSPAGPVKDGPDTTCHTPAVEEPAPGIGHSHDASHGNHGGALPADMPDAPEGASTAHASHDGDCCEDGTCRCSCMHTCHAMVRAIAAVPAVIEHASSSGRMPASHAPPALPHLIRPPIG
ncbi:CopL family metal-binding regulatory protein [Novilysobacter selenitireducens]|uniref:CopL family metal-binding regulatory protein n=1 Tax=Novilysobacter selenitireducens TaxID=2872639 RepID=A0ABS7T591_9GAMM|nr:CopL family metal-binding regulatory protein [Lysobacter selenitireducens]MBZ4039042.1 CopL family metal-binding regulatory protein [Lysobacter selenitireducens]